MSQTALTADVEPFIFEPSVASVSFKGARLLTPIYHRPCQEERFMYWQGKRLSGDLIVAETTTKTGWWKEKLIQVPAPQCVIPGCHNHTTEVCGEYPPGRKYNKTTEKELKGKKDAPEPKKFVRSPHKQPDVNRERFILERNLDAQHPWSHPIHREWTEADFERLWRFDENSEMTREDWSHPAHTKSTIPPASQTAALWHHLRDNGDSSMPVILLSVASCLDFGTARKDLQVETETSREFAKALVEMYQQDSQTQAEWEDLARMNGIKKASRHRHFSGAHVTPRILYVLGLAKPEEELKAEWKEILKQQGLPKLEIFQTQDFQTRDFRTREWRDSNDDTSDPSEGLRIINEGLRETTAPVEERKEEFPTWRKLINPHDLSLAEWAEPETEKEKKDIAIIMARNLTVFHNTTVEEAIAQTGLKMTPAALVKAFARFDKKKGAIDWNRAIGNYYCVIHLGGRSYLKVLGSLGAPASQIWESYLSKRRDAKIQAAKKERRKKDKTGLPERIKVASDRIQQAYGESMIYAADPAFWKPPEGTHVTDSSNSSGRALVLNHGLDEGTDVTDSSIGKRR
jgi:hypothetical protein